MREVRTRPLLTWEGVPGFLCDWHLAGPFESGLVVDPNVRLFDPKRAPRWECDHLAPWGGCARVRGALPLPACGRAPAPAWAWDLLPLDWHPELRLKLAAQDFPAWRGRLAGLDSDSWSRLYYALALVRSPRAADADLVFSGWDGCRLWINGRLAFEEHSYHHTILDMERIRFRLRRGVNAFLFQLDRDGVAARIEAPGGRKAVAGLRSVAARPPPEPRRVGTIVQLRRHALGLPLGLPFHGRTPADLIAWQRSFRRHFERCLGPAPVAALRRGAAEHVGEERGDGYMRRRYHLPSEGDSLVPAYVLSPDAALCNGRALVVAHGHESHFQTVSGADRRPVDPHSPTRNYGERLARQGYTVAVMCERAFSERDDRLSSADLCNTAHAQALAMGLTLPRLHIADLQVLLDLVLSLPGVDSRRVGLTGLSGGGTLTYLAAALDRRFRAAAVFCGMCRYRDYASGTDGCGMQVVPGLFPTGDVGEVLSLIAPRPLLLAQGRLDSTFNVISFRGIAADARRAYRAAGVADRLQAEVYERPHQYDVDLADRFFLACL